MPLRRVALPVLLLLIGSSCSRDPQVVKQKYLESGNRYFEKGKYKEAALMYRNALKKDLRFGEAYYRLGLTELKLQQPSAAVAALTRAVELTRYPDARVQLGEVYLAAYLTERRADARAEYLRNIKRLADDLLKLDPKSSAAFRLLGYLSMYRDNDWKAAVGNFRKADELAPGKAENLYPLAQSLLADNRFEEFEKTARLLIAGQKTFTLGYELLSAYYLTRRNLPAAETILKEEVANNPKRPDSFLRLAYFYFATQRTQDMATVLTKLGSDVPDGRKWAGDFYFRIRDYDNATQQYQQGLSNTKDKESYQNRIAQVLLARGKVDEAAKLVDQVLKESPNNPGAQALHAQLLISSGNPERLQQAINDFQRLVGQMPNNAPLRFNLARALWLKGDNAQAQTQVQEAIKTQRAYVPARLLLAQLRLQSEDYAAVAQQADAVLSLDPRNLQARIYRARALMGRQDPRKDPQGWAQALARARQELETALKEHPNSNDATIELATLDMASGQYSSAEGRLKALYARDPSDTRALMGLTEVYALQRQFDKGLELLKDELARKPGRTDLRSAIANLEVRSGRYDLAIAEYRGLLKENPKSADLYFRLAETCRRKGDIPAALDAFRNACNLRPNDVRPCLRMALLLDETGQRKEARATYEQILNTQPDNPIALNNLAYIIAESGGDLDQALTLAQRAKQRLPQDPNVADTLGWIYIRKNLSDSAIEIYRDLVGRQPEVSTFRYHLAMALYQKGDKREAKKELTLALQKKPPKDEEVKIKELMSKLG